MSTTEARPRRGWREKKRKGVYRQHTVACPSSLDEKEGRRCKCPLTIAVPRPDGKTTQVSFAGTVSEAVKERARRYEAHDQAKKEAALAGSARQAPVTMRIHAAKCLQEWHAKPDGFNNFRNRRHDYVTLIDPFFGEVLLTDEQMTAERVDMWKTQIEARIRPEDEQTVERHRADRIARARGHDAPRDGRISYRDAEQALRTLKALLNRAVRWNRLSASPAKGVKLSRRDTRHQRESERVLARPELERLLKACEHRPRARSMFGVGGKLGLRRGEIAGLIWPDVDLDGRKICLVRQVVIKEGDRTPDGQPVPTHRVEQSLKNRQMRTVRIPKSEVPHLRAWYRESVLQGKDSWDELTDAEREVAEQRAKGRVWPGNAPARRPQGVPENAVLDAVNERTCGRLLERWLFRSGLWAGVDSGPAPISFHGLRHTCASIMLLEGRPMSVVSRILGHQLTETTERYYRRFLPSSIDAAIDETWD